MTNTELNNLIATINTGGLNTATEVRDVLQGIKNEMFQATHIQSVASNGSNFNYSLKFNKIGNICLLEGYIKNDTFNILNAFDNSILITNSIFYPKIGEYTSLQCRGNYSMLINIFDNRLNLSEYIFNSYDFSVAIPVGAAFNFNGFYKINN